MIVLSGNISKNFTQAEYHKGNATVYFKAGTMTFVRCLQAFRNWIKTPMYVISWYRTPAENKAIGGISSSNHLNGCACDFKLSFPITKSLFIKYAKQWATICKQNGCVGEAGLYNRIWPSGWQEAWYQGSIQFTTAASSAGGWYRSTKNFALPISFADDASILVSGATSGRVFTHGGIKTNGTQFEAQILGGAALAANTYAGWNVYIAGYGRS